MCKVIVLHLPLSLLIKKARGWFSAGWESSLRLLFAGAGLFFRLFEKEAVDVITEPADICKVAGGQAYLHLLYLIQPLSATQQGLAHQMKVLETDFPHILTLVSRFSSQCVCMCAPGYADISILSHTLRNRQPLLWNEEKTFWTIDS